MSNAKKCDRCGKLYELYEGFPVQEGGNRFDKFILVHHWSSAGRDYDLCPECMKLLIKWIKEADDEHIQ